MIDRIATGANRLVVSVGATLGFLQSYALPFEWNRGPAGRWWEAVRRRVSRTLGSLFDERAGPRPVTDAEFAGTLPMSLDEAERTLRDAGFVRNPFSRLKTRDGEPEIGSWARRAGPLAERQVHVMLFEHDGSGIDVYAHEEPSSVNPFTGGSHYGGRGQNVALGVERARKRLPLDDSAARVEPVAAPWDEQPGT